MKYDVLMAQFVDQPFFQTADVSVWFDEPVKQIQARLSRWVQQGKLIRVRRGMYSLPDAYRRLSVSGYYLSNYLYRPSYVSLFTALEYYAMIPEAVYEVEAVTTRQTKEWETPLGRFIYRSIKPSRFFGYQSEFVQADSQRTFLCAEPEKALLDVFYYQKGPWPEARIRELRLQNVEQITSEKLMSYAERMNSPKVLRAARLLNKLRKEL